MRLAAFRWRQVADEALLLRRTSRFAQTAAFYQHGGVTVYRHCIAVACLSCCLAERFYPRADYRALIRGALLHDYFLYDWHRRGEGHRLHGFRHPALALCNARQDVPLTSVEAQIILRHMFPLVPIPPTCAEAWLVCLADKLCAVRETLWGRGK